MPPTKFLVAGALILGAISYLVFSGANNSMVYYYTVSELLEKAQDLSDQGVRVSGHVSPGSIQRDDPKGKVDFLVMERATSKSIPVTYEGIIPDTFKDDAEVVVEGRYALGENRFHANVLLAKCPSKYEAADGYEGKTEVTSLP